MARQDTKYTFTFALIVCVICSLLLSFVSEGLREKKELNIALDIKKNILKAVDLRDPLPKKATSAAVLEVYKKKIEELVIDPQGNIVEGKGPQDIKEGEKFYPLYIYREGQQIVSYSFPIVGKGLWSTLYGYFALEPDAITVRGISFYQHGETPGLGGEIEKDWFQNNFKGKKVWDLKGQELIPVRVVKGKVKDKIAQENQDFFVDGISGATITSKGVTEMLDREVKKYEPYFRKIRKR